ncbi:hypothetical protein [Xylocopilactobacillus apis]|uniref:Tetratricopeptide repeat protein n=1 Tax=Xylocopilactobacillus apis TaxID=2932183 RepID=A0AAU9CP73_9LACO|nr:hypothetical protein [Xylocopilactobacillus apis]BDR55762.1 hypothetical protein KIMC2_03240 [Xylocopilactobacillus apis]
MDATIVKKIDEGLHFEAKKWAKDIFKCNIPEKAASELIDLGRVHFELGEDNEAYECFLKAYDKDQAFKEYDDKYWEFFKSIHYLGEEVDRFKSRYHSL